LALDHPESVIGIHLTTLESDLAPAVEDTELSDVERSYLAANRSWDATERGYSAIQSTKPQTVGYGLNDSPAGLAAYVGEKWHSWSDVTPPDDFLCATLTLYWVTQTITSSMRDYSETRVDVSRNHSAQVDATIRERQPCTKFNRTQLLWFRSIGTIAGTRSPPLTSARPRRLAFSRTRPFPRASRRARIWSACTTSSAGQSFPAPDTSPRLRNQRRSLGI